MVEERALRSAASIARTGGLLLITALFCAPLVFMVSGSLRPVGSPPPRTLEIVPAGWTTANYGEAIRQVDLDRKLANSGIVALLTVPTAVVVASAAGFALARSGARARAVGAAVTLVALSVPTMTIVVGRFAVFRTLGLTNTYIPLVANALLGMSPLFVLVFLWSFRRVPPELFDAARLEGLSPFGVWRRVAVPLVRPTTAAVAALAFVASWGGFLDPLLYLNDRDLATAPLGLRQLAALDATAQPVFLAGAVLTTVPVLAGLALAGWSMRRPVLPDVRASVTEAVAT